MVSLAARSRTLIERQIYLFLDCAEVRKRWCAGSATPVETELRIAHQDFGAAKNRDTAINALVSYWER